MRKFASLLGLLISIVAVSWAEDPYSQAGLYMVGNGQIRSYGELGIVKPKPVAQPTRPMRFPGADHEVLEPIIEEPVHQAPVSPLEKVSPTIPVETTSEPQGGPVSVLVPQRINSGHFRAGDILKLKMENPVMDRGGRILVKKNAEVLATIKWTRGGGLFSRRGVINIALDYARGQYGEKIPLSGTISQYGGGNRNLTLAGAILVAWPLFFLQGSNAVIEAGTTIPANIVNRSYFHEPTCMLEVAE